MTEQSNVSIHQEKKIILPPLINAKNPQNKVVTYETGRLDTEENKIIPNENEAPKIVEDKKDHEKNDTEKDKKEEPKKSVGIYGAVFAMTSLSIGTGCLTFTKRVIQFGFVWFGVLLIVAGVATYWTLCGIIKAAEKEKNYEFSSLVKKVIGKFPAVLLDVMTIIYSWGLIITYEVIMNSLVGRTIYIFFKNKETYPTFDDYEDQEWDSVKIKVIVLVVINVLLTPLCLAKDIGKMKFFSLFGIIALFYTIIVLIIECPYYWIHYTDNVYVKDDKTTHANWIDISKSFNSNLDFFTGFATIIFAYSCHQGSLPVYRTVENNDLPKMKKIFIGSIVLDLLIYFLTYISSFLTTPLESKDLIIYRESIFNNDIFMNIAKIAVFLELFFLIPSNYNSMRCSLFQMIFKSEEVKIIPNIILTVSTLVLSAVIGAVYSEILNYISLLGGFCCTTYCFFVPGWLMIKSEWEEMSKLRRVLTIIGIGILSLLGFIGGVMSIILFFK